MNSPTTQSYNNLITAYDFFNRKLFAGSLRPCLITMQRHRGSYGYFSGSRFENTANPKEITDEIALNPVHFAGRRPEEVLATLAHEMVHLWRHHRGDPPRRRYHDREWASQMLAIGLIPTATGETGGKITGQKMTHVIEKDGAYARAVSTLIQDHPAILYADRAEENDQTRKKEVASKTKYTCPECGLNAWAKPDAPLLCGNCRETMQSEQASQSNSGL